MSSRVGYSVDYVKDYAIDCSVNEVIVRYLIAKNALRKFNPYDSGGSKAEPGTAGATISATGTGCVATGTGCVAKQG